MFQEIREIEQSTRRIGRELQSRQRWCLAGALVLMLLTGALTNVPPLILGRLLDRFIDTPHLSFNIAWPYLGVIFASVIIREGIHVVRRYLVEDTCTRVCKSVTVKAVNHLLRLDLGFFSERLVGSLHGRLNRSIEGLVRMIKLCFLDFLPSLFVAGIALVVVFSRAPLLGGAMFLVVPLGFFIVFRQVSSQKGIRISLLRKKEDIDGAVVELLGGLESVRSMNTEDFETSRVEQIAEKLRAKEIIHHVWMAFYDSAKSINEGICHILVLGLSIWLASKGRISTGDILTYSMLFIGVITPLREVHRILDEAHESSIRVLDLIELFDTPEDKSFSVSQAAICQDVGGEKLAVEISDLEFSYPGSTSPIIENFRLAIRKGEYIGICGPAGCGKSTLLKILIRLIHPRQGTIKLFGRDMTSMSRRDLALSIGYVSQNPFIISGTLRENIAYGFEDVPDEAIEQAARRANIHDEILAFPKGYQTLAGERGQKLSGGQRQRIALARVFLRAPDLLILDEATAALDNLNEKAVQDAIEQAMQGRTVIAVAHRLTTLKGADRILVFDDGKVVESGTYNELLNGSGLFSKLAQALTTGVEDFSGQDTSNSHIMAEK